jgi:hypothetical protein
MNEPDQHHPRGAMSVNDFAVWAGIGRTSAWKEIREGRLRAVKGSARTIVIVDDAKTWLTSRPPVGSATQNFS